MKTKLRALDGPRKAQLTRQADRMATEFEAQRELDEVCLVVDMDMFYAAVEIRDRPELANKPVAVGGEHMISTTNYHARLKGVRSAMPGFIGRKLCPELVFVKPDYDKYTQVAEIIRAIFREYDPRMRSYSLDEAYLNVTQALVNRLNKSAAASPASAAPPAAAAEAEAGAVQMTVETAAGTTQDELGRSVPSVGFESSAAAVGGEGLSARRSGRTVREERRARLFGAARCLAEEIRGRIKEATKLTASVGIGPNFMLAKIASDWNKPDGQMCIGGDRAEVLRFLHDLPVRKIGGVGKVTEKCLREAIGVVTCGDLFRERAACLHIMTPHTSQWLIKVSLGVGSSDHDVATEQAEAAGAITRKQIRQERTFGELCRPQDLLAKCQEICCSLAAEMATKGLEAKTVGLKVKTTKFHVRTQDSTGKAYICSAEDLFSAASALLQREIRAAAASSSGGKGKLRLRLMGVKASSFRGQARYPTLPGQGTLDGFLASTPTAAAARDATATGSVVATAERGEVGCQPCGGVLPVPVSPRNRRGGGGARVQQRIIGELSMDSRQGSAAAAAATTAAAEAAEVVVVAAPAVAAAATSLTCPVCLEELGAVSNMALNRHVDACVGVCTVGNEGGCGPVVAKRSGAGGFGPGRSKGVPTRKRAKASGAGIERFLTPRERT
ncbi:unnamed protein product [Laminaria digitata]